VKDANLGGGAVVEVGGSSSSCGRRSRYHSITWQGVPVSSEGAGTHVEGVIVEDLEVKRLWMGRVSRSEQFDLGCGSGCCRIFALVVHPNEQSR